MKGAYKNDIKQLTSLSTFTIGFGLGILQSPPLIYALLSVHYVHIYNKISKILKNMWVFCPHCILMLVGRLVVVIDVNPSHGFWTRRLMKLFGHEGK
jgi:hypothetical protein